MFRDYATVLHWFESLPKRFQYPTLHPHYVFLEASTQDPDNVTFYLDYIGENFIYIPGITFLYHGIKDFQSPRGYGGVLSDLPEVELSLAIKRAQNYFFEQGYLCAFLRNTPLLSNHEAFPTSSRFDRNTVAINLTPPDLISTYKSRVRTGIRKAIKHHIKVELACVPAQWGKFSSLYEARMRELQAAEQYHYSTPFFHRLSSWSRAKLYLCYKDERVISGAIFVDSGKYSEYLFSAASATGLKYSSTQLAIHQHALIAKSNDIQYLHLGGGVSRNRDDRLLYFKRGFSDTSLPFYITGWIFDRQKYEQLRSQSNQSNDKIIFYRQ